MPERGSLGEVLSWVALMFGAILLVAAGFLALGLGIGGLLRG